MDRIRAVLGEAVLGVKTVIEAASVVIIAAGLIAVLFLSVWRRGQPADRRFREVRLRFSRHLSLALELLLASDILATALEPSWEDIGKLAAIATIRTALNYFLERDMRDFAPDS